MRQIFQTPMIYIATLFVALLLASPLRGEAGPRGAGYTDLRPGIALKPEMLS